MNENQRRLGGSNSVIHVAADTETHNLIMLPSGVAFVSIPLAVSEQFQCNWVLQYAWEGKRAQLTRGLRLLNPIS